MQGLHSLQWWRPLHKTLWAALLFLNFLVPGLLAAPVHTCAYLIYISTEEYELCAAIAALSIRHRNTSSHYPVILGLLTPIHTEERIARLRPFFDDVVEFQQVENPNDNYNSKRKENFAVLRMWEQYQYTHIVSVDADMIALGTLDPLCHIQLPSEMSLAAVQDFSAGQEGWRKSVFNGGMLLLQPGRKISGFLEHLVTDGAEDFQKINMKFQGGGGVQPFLNENFPKWKRLDKRWNCPVNLYDFFPKSFRRLDCRIVHYTSPGKVHKRMKKAKAEGSTKICAAPWRFYYPMMCDWDSPYYRWYNFLITVLCQHPAADRLMHNDTNKELCTMRSVDEMCHLAHEGVSR